jgi:hypothetical protein
MSDAQSLTLPTYLSRVKVKWKKPRKPSFMEIVYLIQCIVDIYLAGQDLAKHYSIQFGITACIALFFYHEWRRLRKGRLAILQRLRTSQVFFLIALLFFLQTVVGNH